MVIEWEGRDTLEEALILGSGGADWSNGIGEIRCAGRLYQPTPDT